MYAIAHATEEGIVIDLEPVDADGDEMLEGALRAQSSVKRAVSHVQDAFEKGAYFQSVTDELRALLGYDRVMLYRFHEDDHGEVVAESTSQHARDAFKGLHFPATDIPQANRKIFMSMRSRMIADVSGPASKVRQCKRTPDDILLSDSQLRGISGCHAQYLSNMGVKATLVVSVVVTAPRSAMRDAASDESRQRRRRSRGVSTSAADRESWDGGGDDDGGSQSPPQEKLWGLIVCHHYQGPHRVAYYQRSAAEFLVRVFSLQLSRILQSEQAKIESSLLSHQGTICKSLKYVEEMTGFNAELTPQIFSSVMSMEPGSSALFKVANASGAAMIIGDTIFHAGECPPDDEIAAIVAWVLQSKDAAQDLEGLDGGKEAIVYSTKRRLPLGGMWSTDCLSREGMPNAEALKATASGVVVVDVAPLVLPTYNGESAAGGGDDANRKTKLKGAPAATNISPAVLAWFRGEYIKENTWAGDKDAPQAHHRGVEMTPRESFRAIKETLTAQSEPWRPHEKASAAAMQLLFRDTIAACRAGGNASGGARRASIDESDASNAAAEELRTIIGTADVPVIKVDASMTVTEHNKFAASVLVGASRSAVGHKISEFLEPNSANFLDVTLRNAFKELVEPRPFAVQFKLARSAGDLMEARKRATSRNSPKPRYLAILLFAKLVWNASAETSAIVLTGRDMTTHRTAMRDLTLAAFESGSKPEKDLDVSEVMSDVMIAAASVDGEGRVDQWNERMEFATGLRRADALGKLFAGEVLGTKGALHVLPNGAANADPMTEVQARLVQALDGDANGELGVDGVGARLMREELPATGESSAATSETETDTDTGDGSTSTTMHAGGGGVLDRRLTSALNEHALVRFLKASNSTGGAAAGGGKRTPAAGPATSSSAISAPAAMEVLAFFLARPESDGAFIFFMDMSMPRAMEKALSVQHAAEAASDAKSRHIAFMSHEIRNPVNGILASVEAINEMMPIIQRARANRGESGGVDDAHYNEVEELVLTTLACSDQLRRTVDDMLDLDKLEEGKLVLTLAPFSVRRMLRSVSMQVNAAARAKNLRFVTSVSPLLADVALVGDAGRIQQVLTNFCWNAVKFTTEGVVTVEVTCDARVDADDEPITCFFKVIDTGQGMSKQTMENIFDRFSMANHKVDKYGGSGLGLTICRSLAELMHGQIHCMSVPGEGSTFVLELSLDAVEPDPADASSMRSGASAGTKSRRESIVFDAADASAARSRRASFIDGPNVASVPVTDSRDDDDDAAAATTTTTTTREPRQRQPRDILPRPFSRRSVLVTPDGREVEVEHPADASPPPSFFQTSPSSSAAAAAWKVHVVREQIGETSVAVLADVSVGEETRQHWGGAACGVDGVGPALARATEDAIARALRLYASESGIPSPARDANGGIGGFPSPSPSPLARGPTPSSAARASSSPPRFTRDESPAKASLADRLAFAAAIADDSSPSIPTPAPTASQPQTSSRPQPQPQSQSQRTHGQKPMSVLIVDDDVVNVKILKRAFVKNGDDVTTGEDGQDVVRLLLNESKRYDVVLLDENMRHMNGSAAVEETRRHEASAGDDPDGGERWSQLVVATTGNAAMSDKSKYQKAGFNGVLQKPMKLSTLVRWVHDFHAFWRATGGGKWTPGDPVPAGCVAPTISDASAHEDGYFIGDLEVFGTKLRREK